MAFLEWRRFTFFDVHRNVDEGKIAECLQDTNVTVATSGNNHVVLCDATGWAHVISRSWIISSFKAYELTVTLAQQLQHDPYLVTIGEDEPGVNPLIKVWDWMRVDRHGAPTCVRVSRAVPSHLRATPATAVAVHDNKNLMAVGFQDGSVVIFRGDITRQRSGKMKTLPDTGTSPITTLAFKGTDTLFVVSRAAVAVVQLSGERVTTLERTGAPPHCALLAHTQQLMLATQPAIYCYTTEGRGPCYALEGEKVRLDWFRSYLVITTNETTQRNDASTSNSLQAKSHHITILDIQNKFIVFSKTFDEIDAVITEWGSFYILTKNKEMIYLNEKDLQSKLTSLFKKNLYDVAIRIASSQHYDAAGLMEIYKQYGDHLYAKGDLKGAIDQYVRTIGWLETSYVIRKYLESRYLEPLIIYLEELHKKGYATEDHTTLLLTCYVKIDQNDQHGKLKEFISNKNKSIEFDVDVAVKVVRQVSPDDALTLAATHKCHDWYLKIMLEDKQEHNQAVAYIAELEFEDADTYMKKYGHSLMQYAPEETTELLKLLCTDYRPRSHPLVDEISLHGGIREPDRTRPDEYVHLFLNNSYLLVSFLEHMLASDVKCSQLIYNTLIEHYIHVWAKSDSEQTKMEYEEKVMRLLKNPDADYDKDQTLITCQMLGFNAGVLYLYEENKLWLALVRRGADVSVSGGAGARLCMDALWAAPARHALPPLLTHIQSKNLLSPMLVIDCLTSSPNYTLGDAREYLTSVFEYETSVITREQANATKYKSECSSYKEALRGAQTEPIVLQRSRCAACNRALDLPALHFLCPHSYHQHCFQSYSESENECPMCEKTSRPAAPKNADTLHGRLHNEVDPYAVVSEYFGRGLFNKVAVVTEPTVEQPAPSVAPVVAPTYGPGAEARLRLQEGQSKQLYVSNSTRVPKGTSVIPVPEGRMRMMEQQQYSSSLEANLTRLPEQRRSPQPRKRDTEDNSGSPKISSAISNVTSGNPFEMDNYDDTKNPFAEEPKNPFEEDDDPTNPFADDDDYDKELNPFES